MRSCIVSGLKPSAPDMPRSSPKRVWERRQRGLLRRQKYSRMSWEYTMTQSWPTSISVSFWLSRQVSARHLWQGGWSNAFDSDVTWREQELTRNGKNWRNRARKLGLVQADPERLLGLWGLRTPVVNLAKALFILREVVPQDTDDATKMARAGEKTRIDLGDRRKINDEIHHKHILGVFHCQAVGECAAENLGRNLQLRIDVFDLPRLRAGILH